MEKSGENAEDELAEVTVLRSLELAGGAYFIFALRRFLFTPASALQPLEAVAIHARLICNPETVTILARL